ncbi:hypothetical protein CVV38_02465 [Candidatus Peregrinibacteria bacterium HGW-Peregrinibacteria-1]|jgi:hypothetical protein|nr:MAG: hypothetical protein CVV38_02465 [Candidatus Peregrinibacteria bacterium HGW-Peregrinibacteria-1]
MTLEQPNPTNTPPKPIPTFPRIDNFIKDIGEKLLQSCEATFSEDEIRKNYINLPAEKITLLCSYTTRLEGFLDILLSRNVISSREATKLLGTVHTHRGNSMGDGRKSASYSAQNDYISLSTGFVSFKYSDPSIAKREDYIGGYGFFTPLQSVLDEERLSFSHCSSKGGIKNYDLNRSNITSAVHQSRSAGDLFDDGFGNTFEVQLMPTPKDGSYTAVLEYPKIPLSDGVLAIPLDERSRIEELLHKRQEMYQKLADDISAIRPERATEWQYLDGRDLLNPQITKEYLSTMLHPISLSELPIFWYPQRNLDLALQYLSQK